VLIQGCLFVVPTHWVVGFPESLECIDLIDLSLEVRLSESCLQFIILMRSVLQVKVPRLFL
jgi:hypothetical protein